MNTIWPGDFEMFNLFSFKVPGNAQTTEMMRQTN